MRTKHVAGTAVAYEEQGLGERIVLVHAGGNTSAQWRAIARRLASSFHVVMPELHGHGDTPRWSQSRAMELDDEAALIEAFCQSADQKVHLVGHSFGGAVASRVALRGKVALASLVLIEPMVFPLLREAGQTESWQQTWQRRQRFAALHRAGDDDAALREWVEHYAEMTWDRVPEATRHALIARADVIESGWHALSNNSTTLDELRRLELPTRVLIGTETTSSLAAASELVVAAMPNAEATYIERAAHMMPLSHPDEVAEAIASMARRCSAVPELSAHGRLEICRYEQPGRTPRLDTCPASDLAQRATHDARWVVRHPDAELTDTHVAALVCTLRSQAIPGLSLAGCQRLSGNALAHVGRLENLQILDLFRVPIADRDLAHLWGLRALATLDLSGTPITDAAGEFLAALTNLEELHLGWTEIGDPVLEALAGLPRLRWLDLSGTKVTATGLASLARTPCLEHVALRETAVGDASLAQLGALADRLRSLDISYTRVGPESVEHLLGLTKLRRLVLRATRIPASADARLLERLPELGAAQATAGLVR
jgi:pimeloyl-ACP methyl ester carboxylesterase